MRKLLRVTFFFVLFYVGLCTTLPLRLVMLWPQMQWGFEVVESSGSLFSGYHLKLAKESHDEKWSIADLFLNRENSRWLIRVTGVQLEISALKSLQADLEPLRDLQTRLAELQSKPLIFEARNLSLRMARNWPRLNCSKILLNGNELNLSCDAIVSEPELTLRLFIPNSKISESATLTLFKDAHEKTFAMNELKIRGNELIFPATSLTKNGLTLSFNFEGIAVR